MKLLFSDTFSGYTPLHYAVRQSSEDLVRALLEKGADPNAQTPSGLTSPLHRAAAKGRPEIVKLLLGKKQMIKFLGASTMTAENSNKGVTKTRIFKTSATK